MYTAPLADSMADGLTNYISNPADGVIAFLNVASTSTNLFPVPLSSNMQSITFTSSFDAGYNHDFRGYVQAYMS